MQPDRVPLSVVLGEPPCAVCLRRILWYEDAVEVGQREFRHVECDWRAA